jgi:hypothetical protein
LKFINYVYCHFEGDEVVYVGAGCGGRAWQNNGNSRRNDEHKDWMDNKILDAEDFVKVVHTRVSKEESKRLERELIEELQPKYNYEFTEAWLKEKSEQGRRMAQSHNRRIMTPNGVFDSIVKAAKAHSIHPNTIAYRCNVNPKDYYYLEESKHWRTTHD